MCTVTFAAINGRTVITSNRDEQVVRPSMQPLVYSVGHKRLLFPKDPRAGGTWFSVDENGNAAVLLNGGFEKHVRKSSYERSRGLIVLDIISDASPIICWKQINLTKVEPFTLILFESQNLYQLVWDGFQKHCQHLDSRQSYIWSSSTLYPAAVRAQRQLLFTKFIYDHIDVTADELFDFHKNTSPLDHENGLVINRNGILKTLTITQAIISEESTLVKHDDLINNMASLNEIFHLQKSDR
ncbi:MAG TPA: NRDE family protein [Flavobacterium sp.]|jgi:hypothetical protein|nr:NRDE family protein [Flavobacterium sp.]